MSLAEMKKHLIDALSNERDSLKYRGYETIDHDISIDYLRTGITKENPDMFDLLDACINDFETLYNDYVTTNQGE